MDGSSEGAPGESRGPHRAFDLVVADVGWFTTANLFRELPTGRADALLLRCSDYRVAWSQGKRPPGWNSAPTSTAPGVWEQDLVLPTGWMKSYPRIGMGPIARAVRRWRPAVGAPRRPLVLVATYPYYVHLARMLRPDCLVYYNLDDYRLYWPRSARQVERVEDEMVRAADVVACASLVRVGELRGRAPDVAPKIRHLPHGAPTPSIPARPQHLPGPPPADLRHLPRPWIGYVGTMGDRVAWDRVDSVATANPGASVILVGQVGDDGPASWEADRRRCLGRRNVHAVGWRDQAALDSYNRSFDVGLIPYRDDHPFNIACCPTKIMDYMAAGRPVVATGVPECRAYSEVFDVVEGRDFVAAVGARLRRGPDDGRAAARWELARAHSCAAVVGRLLGWIEGAITPEK